MPTVFYTCCMIMSTLLWGISISFAKVGLREVNLVTFLFFRFLIALIIMLIFVLFKKLPWKKYDTLPGIKLGILLGGVVFLQTMGLQTISASLSSFLLGISVVFILIIRFLNKKQLPSMPDLAVVLMCIVGLGLATYNTGGIWKLGVVYSLGASLCLALHTYILDKYNQAHIAILLLIKAACILALAVLCYALLGVAMQIPTLLITWCAIIYCAVFGTCVAALLQIYSQRHLGAFRVGLILTLEPVFTTFFSCLLFNEVAYSQFYMGAALILGAIVLVTIRLKRL